MSMRRFTPQREDGRSDRHIAFELLRDAEPGTVFAFDRVAAALQSGVETPITHARVCAAVRAAQPVLLRESRRATVTVRGVGYRVVAANEHVSLALMRKDRAELQVRSGVRLLEGTRLDELTETERRLHEGHFIIMSRIYNAVLHLQTKAARHEQLLSGLTARVEKLESA